MTWADIAAQDPRELAQFELGVAQQLLLKWLARRKDGTAEAPFFCCYRNLTSKCEPFF